MIVVLMISAKLTILGLLKKKTLWNKGYDVIVFAQDVTRKILLADWN